MVRCVASRCFLWYNVTPFIPSEVLEITKLEAQCIVLLEVSNP
jgi:hypothetical protein